MDKRYGILVICAAILVLCFVGTASAKTWYVDDDGGADFSGIQNAINNASVGDTILVYSGVYYENVVVNKSVTLKGVNLPVVDAGMRSAITLTADGITLVGFTTTNSGLTLTCLGTKRISSITGDIVSNNNNAGIYLFGSNNIITGNNVSNNWNGISLSSSSSNNSITGNNVCNNSYGIRLSFSCNNSITGNTFINDGLSVYKSYQNTVENNTVNGKPLVYLEDASDYRIEDAGQVILVNCTDITVENLDLSNTNIGIDLLETEDSKILNNIVCNNMMGIELYDSCNNTITGNNASNNRGSGIYLSASSNNTITGNNGSSNGNNGIYLSASSNNTITGNNGSSNGYRDIGLTSSSNNSITGNNFCNGWAGLILHSSSSNNSITGNNFCNGWIGIGLVRSSNNTITGNNVSNNNDGIWLHDSSNNHIYLNNFIKNRHNVDSSALTNIWNSPLEITYTYNGTTHKSYLGNYWDDYKGTDAEGDGIGDIYYGTSKYTDSRDDYPLMKPFENYILPRSAPA